jgi:outer membrane protein OmpA-like peptidoglycan-associated protein
MADIFLSYAAEDRDFARRLAATLENAGWSVWWDRKIPPGVTFAETIERELGACRCVVVIWSAHSVGSQWVRTESNEALERRILVPVSIESVRPPFEFRHLQAADLAGWSGDADNHELRAVIARITELIQVTPPPGVRQTHDELPSSSSSISRGGLRNESRIDSALVDRVATGASGDITLLAPGASRRRTKVFGATVALLLVAMPTGYWVFDRFASRPAPDTPAPLAPATSISKSPEKGADGGARSPEPENAPDPKKESASPVNLNRQLPLMPVFFPENSALITAEARRVLDANAATLKQYTNWAITLEGHTQEGSDPEESLRLGERRALAVRDYLISAGISSDRLRTVSYGREFPFEPGDANQWKNQRVHFVITAK